MQEDGANIVPDLVVVWILSTRGLLNKGHNRLPPILSHVVHERLEEQLSASLEAQLATGSGGMWSRGGWRAPPAAATIQ